MRKKIGSGSFGEIYEGMNLQTHEKVAIKLEKTNTQHPQLLYESNVIRLLQGGPGLPTVHWFGTEGNYNLMVLDLLGPSLEDLFTSCNKKLSTKTSLMIIDQMLCRIEYMHSKNFIHRDIKPDNFLMGLGKRSSLVYVIDFGLAKKYRDPKTSKHIPYRDGKSLTGTARYASINAHVGIEQSRRDDLEGIGYVALYFLRGALPWQGINAHDRDEKYKKIMEHKISTSVGDLCKGFPEEFCVYLNYCKSLKFDDRPDYRYLRRMFKDLFVREGYEYDYLFDWKLENCVEGVGRSKSRQVLEEEKKNIEDSQRAVRNHAPVERGSAPVAKSTEKKTKKSCIMF